MQLTHRYWTGPDEPAVEGPVWHDDDLPLELEEWVDRYAGNVNPDDLARHRSNIIRWFLLLEHGGIWLDHDAEVLATPPGSWVLTFRGHVCPAAMSLPRGHPLALEMLELIAAYDGPRDRAPFVSGQRLLARAIRHHAGISRRPLSDEWVRHRWDTSRGE